jgi:hypothetical protein
MNISRIETMGSLARLTTLAGLVVASGACATTGATLGSGVGDRYLEYPPYYAGSRFAQPGLSIAHLPITYQRGATHSEIFDPGAEPGSAVAVLLREMNQYLDELQITTRIATPGERVPGTPPDVHFGCIVGTTGECETEQRVDRDNKARMRLAVGRPSSSWTGWTAAALQNAQADATLVITLEVGQYWIQPRGWRNDKTVELGTNHAVRLPWLTALDRPVMVLQLTGALVGPDGKAVRIGAEGMLARRTDLVLGSFGMQRLISDEDVERLRTSRRSDLAGNPLVWEVALSNLIAQLTGNPEVAVR